MNHVINGIIFVLIYLAVRELTYMYRRWRDKK